MTIVELLNVLLAVAGFVRGAYALGIKPAIEMRNASNSMFVIYTISASVQDVAEGNRREGKARLGPRNLKNCRAVPRVRSRRGDLPCKTFLPT